jgi:hypothetical protein
MPNRFPLVVNQTSGVIQELQAVDGLELGNSAIANVGNLNITGTATLGAVGNVKITGGSNGQVLKTDGTGNLSWALDTATAGGSNTHVQFNNSGAFAGSAGFTFNSTSNAVSVTGTATVGNLSTSGTVQAVGNVQGGNIVASTGVLVLNTSIPGGTPSNGTIAIDAANNRIGVYYSGSWKYATLV